MYARGIHCFIKRNVTNAVSFAKQKLWLHPSFFSSLRGGSPKIGICFCSSFLRLYYSRSTNSHHVKTATMIHASILRLSPKFEVKILKGKKLLKFSTIYWLKCAKNAKKLMLLRNFICKDTHFLLERTSKPPFNTTLVVSLP